MVAIFTMGIVFPFANQKGAVSGAVIGCLCGWILYAGAKTWPKSEFLANRIPTEANFDQCPSGWVEDVNLFLSSNWKDLFVLLNLIYRLKFQLFHN